MTSMTTFIFFLSKLSLRNVIAKERVQVSAGMDDSAVLRERRPRGQRQGLTVKVKRALCGDAIVIRCCRRLVWVWFNLPSCTLSSIISAYNCARFGWHFQENLVQIDTFWNFFFSSSHRVLGGHHSTRRLIRDAARRLFVRVQRNGECLCSENLTKEDHDTATGCYRYNDEKGQVAVFKMLLVVSHHPRFGIWNLSPVCTVSAVVDWNT